MAATAPAKNAVRTSPRPAWQRFLMRRYAWGVQRRQKMGLRLESQDSFRKCKISMILPARQLHRTDIFILFTISAVPWTVTPATAAIIEGKLNADALPQRQPA